MLTDIGHDLIEFKELFNLNILLYLWSTNKHIYSCHVQAIIAQMTHVMLPQEAAGLPCHLRSFSNVLLDEHALNNIPSLQPTRGCGVISKATRTIGRTQGGGPRR